MRYKPPHTSHTPYATCLILHTLFASLPQRPFSRSPRTTASTYSHRSSILFFGILHNGTHESVIRRVPNSWRRTSDTRSSFYTSLSAIVRAHTLIPSGPARRLQHAPRRPSPAPPPIALLRIPCAAHRPFFTPSPPTALQRIQRHALRLAAPLAAPTLRHDSSARDPHRDLELAL
ncbi:hypothetical protein B0H13DRAFT_2315715 [Mycena leptocephala]|nr:hypothetical protein B0H13DRAFT_2315715 [Mycena leptocephala]